MFHRSKTSMSHDYISDEVVGVNTMNLLIKADRDPTLASQPPVHELMAHTIGRRLVEHLPRTNICLLSGKASSICKTSKNITFIW